MPRCKAKKYVAVTRDESNAADGPFPTASMYSLIKRRGGAPDPMADILDS